MSVTLQSVPRKRVPGFTPGLAILSYPEQAAIARPMADQDPTFQFYALRVMNDELWNMIDGVRTTAEIAEAVRRLVRPQPGLHHSVYQH